MNNPMVTVPVDELLQFIQRTIAYEFQKLKNAESKSVLTFKEAAAHLNIAESTLYKFTSSNIIPFSKPKGKKLYFERDKLDEWLLSNSTTSNEEKEVKASTYISTHPAK